MADLKTNYKDDVLDTSVNEKRKFNMIQNSDGTVSFEDVTEYTQTGDSFGAADINATNAAVNDVNSNLSSNTVNGVTYCKVGSARLLQVYSNLNNISSALSELGVELSGAISISGTHSNNNAYKIATLIINTDLTVKCYSRTYGATTYTEETSGYFNGTVIC